MLNESNITSDLVWPWQDEIYGATTLVAIYYCMGSVALVSNGFLLYIIFCQRSSQNDYLPLIGFVFGSATYGVAYLLTAFYRTFVLLSKPDWTLYAICMIYMPFLIIGNTLGCVSLLIVSFEHFLAVASISLYRKFHERRMRIMVTTIVLLICLLDVLLSFLSVRHLLMDKTSPFCYTEEFMPNNYYDFHLILNFIFGLLTSLILIISYCALKWRKKSNEQIENVRQKRTAVVSRSLTQLLVLKIMIQVVPNLIYLIARETPLWQNVKSWSWFLQGANLSIYAIIYLFIDKSFRNRMFQIFARTKKATIPVKSVSKNGPTGKSRNLAEEKEEEEEVKV